MADLSSDDDRRLFLETLEQMCVSCAGSDSCLNINENIECQGLTPCSQFAPNSHPLQLHERRQLLVGSHDKTLAVVLLCEAEAAKTMQTKNSEMRFIAST
jgi:hypothetical protein